jgi:predicted metal-dependent phosphoesterase TrpH
MAQGTTTRTGAKAVAASRDGRGAIREGRLDLHAHSTFSDGSETARTLMRQARALGLAGLAVTDHDCIRQLSAVRQMAREEGLPVLAGCEVSAYDPASGHKVHLLAFGLEATPDESGPLERLMAPTLRARTANTLWQAWKLQRLDELRTAEGEPFGIDRVVEVAGESEGVYKQHVMQAACGLPRTDPAYEALYKRWFGRPDGLVAEDIAYPEAETAVRAILEQGGVPVLAHPGQMDNWAAIPGLVAAGLRGIEVHHPDHTAADVERAREAAAAHGLLMTGGSDFHGRYGAPSALGTCTVGLDEAGEAARDLFEREALLS